MLVLTVGSFEVFGEIWQFTVNYTSDLAFWGFLSFLFSLHILFIYQGLSADAPPPGPTAAAAALTVRAAPPPGPTAAAAVALTVRAAPHQVPRRAARHRARNRARTRAVMH